jgi:hypothetical protein
MQVPVLIEPMSGTGFRASGFQITAEGATREEALKRLRDELDARIKAGAEIVYVDMPAENPWMKMAGMYKDNPMFDEWKQAMADYRDAVDNDEDRP